MNWIIAAGTWYLAHRVFAVDLPRRHRWRATVIATVIAFTLLLAMKLRQSP